MMWRHILLWDGGVHWPMLVSGAFWILVLFGILIGIWFARGWASHPGSARNSRGLELLQERYARGEIDRNEYLQKKQDLGD